MCLNLTFLGSSFSFDKGIDIRSAVMILSSEMLNLILVGSDVFCNDVCPLIVLDITITYLVLRVSDTTDTGNTKCGTARRENRIGKE